MSLFAVLQAIQNVCADIATSIRRLADAGTGFEARLVPLERRVKDLEERQAGMAKLLLPMEGCTAMNREQTNTAGSTAEGATAPPALPLFITVQEYAAILRMTPENRPGRDSGGAYPGDHEIKALGLEDSVRVLADRHQRSL